MLVGNIIAYTLCNRYSVRQVPGLHRERQGDAGMELISIPALPAYCFQHLANQVINFFDAVDQENRYFPVNLTAAVSYCEPGLSQHACMLMYAHVCSCILMYAHVSSCTVMTMMTRVYLAPPM